MRIITGIYKGRHFDVPRTFKARPTTDFAKENLFNVLYGYFDFEEIDYALDLFSGTGSITYELLSRGCKNVVSVEKDIFHQKFIAKVLKELKAGNAQSYCMDVFRFLNLQHKPFNFIFADPPYALKELDELPSLILDKDILAPDGIFVLEHGKDKDFSMHPQFIEHRAYGSVNFSFFRAKEKAV